jgi:DNA modification methylase
MLVQRSATSTRNALNDLSGKEWIKFTKSWFIHHPRRRPDKKLLHPASFPESLIRDFIRFFTRKGELVVDPFLGTGSSLIACVEEGRSGVGFEIVKKYARIAESRVRQVVKERMTHGISPGNRMLTEVIRANSAELSRIWREKRFPLADYCVTSPPYWNQLKRRHIRQRARAARGLDTDYGDDPQDLGNLDDYDAFLQALKEVFSEVYKITKPNGYLTVITNNVFHAGRMYPLAFDTVSTLSSPPFSWVPKDEKVWCQDDKALLPLGVYNAWVGNRHHQYCLIFRKQEP